MSRHLDLLRLAWHPKRRAHTAVSRPQPGHPAMPITVSWATVIASGSSRAAMAGAAPGGTGAGRYVTLVSCQVSGAAALADSGQRKQQMFLLWLLRGCP
jgi:hypothetical protein